MRDGLLVVVRYCIGVLLVKCWYTSSNDIEISTYRIEHVLTPGRKFRSADTVPGA